MGPDGGHAAKGMRAAEETDMVGIIGAMQQEVREIRAMMTDAVTENAGGVEFTCGKIGKESVVAAVCGIGKVFAAMCAQAMILRYRPDCIWNLGVGGALHPEYRILDLAVAEAVVQHDLDLSPLGIPRGTVMELGIDRIPCDPEWQAKIASAAEKAGLHVHRALIASGDTFVASAELKESIRTRFGADVVEMEGAAIGQVCRVNGVPFCVVRSISDGAGDGGELDYLAFCDAAAKNTAAVVRTLFL